MNVNSSLNFNSLSKDNLFRLITIYGCVGCTFQKW